MSDHGGGLLPESQESLAKKSGTGELRNVRFSGWANDGVRIKVKTLEALFTEAPRVHADISKPTLRRERNEPVTQAQEMQLSRHLEQHQLGQPRAISCCRRSLAKSLVLWISSRMCPIQRCANTAVRQHRERQLEKMPEPQMWAPSALQKLSRLKQTTEAERGSRSFQPWAPKRERCADAN
jgi:hypothetical protein